MKLSKLISLAIAACALPLSGLAKPAACKPVGYEYPNGGAWLLLATAPVNNVTDFASSVGAAEVACLYSRPVKVWYSCCDIGYFPAFGSEYGETKLSLSSKLPTQHFSLPPAASGIAGAIFQVFGTSYTLGVWWPTPKVENAALAACKPARPRKTKIEVETPVCEAGYVSFGGNKTKLESLVFDISDYESDLIPFDDKITKADPEDKDEISVEDVNAGGFEKSVKSTEKAGWFNSKE